MRLDAVHPRGKLLSSVQKKASECAVICAEAYVQLSSAAVGPDGGRGLLAVVTNHVTWRIAARPQIILD